MHRRWLYRCGRDAGRDPGLAVLRDGNRTRVDATWAGRKLALTGPDANGHVRIERQLPTAKQVFADIGTTVTSDEHWLLEINDAHPGTHHWRVEMTSALAREGWQPKVQVIGALKATPTHNLVTEETRAWDGEAKIFDRVVTNRIARRLS